MATARGSVSTQREAWTTPNDPPALVGGADAVLAASVFHFGVLRIGDVKGALASAGHPVRVETDHPTGR